MAEPDNIARLIAGGSALFTASNMAVSYAAYRRKRPSLWFTIEKWSHTDCDGTRTPGFLVKLANRGESVIKVEDIDYEYKFLEQPRTLADRIRGRRRYHGRGRHGLATGWWEELSTPLELGPFEHMKIELFFGGCTRRLLEDGVVGRVAISLPGGKQLARRWTKPDPAQYQCSCDSCHQQDVQLSFDDLAAQP